MLKKVKKPKKDNVVIYIPNKRGCCGMLSWLSPVNHRRVMVYVRKPKQTILLSKSDTYWQWNGSLVKPTLRGCVVVDNIHIYMQAGYLVLPPRTSLDPQWDKSSMIPVSQWEKLEKARAKLKKANTK